MIPDGYSLVRLSDGAEINHWPSNAAPPSDVLIPAAKLAVHGISAADLGRDLGGYKLVERQRPDPPSRWQLVTGESVSFDGAKATVAVTLDHVPLVERKSAMKQMVMDRRDEQASSGITFGGKVHQTRPDDRENIAGAAQLAALAVVAGAGGSGNLRWANASVDFAWIAADNSLLAMDAPTVISFAKAAAAFKTNCIFFARALKGAIDAAADHAALDVIDVTAGWPTA